MKTKLPAFLALVLLAPLARAHDFWIEPSTFSPPVGSSVQLALRVGEQFDGEPVARNSAKIESFIVAGPSGERQVRGRDGVDPAGMAKIESAGVHLVGYRSKRSFIELEAAKFEAYLKEEGLDSIIADRAKRGESSKPGKEAYSRCAKCLLSAGTSAQSGFDKPLGLALELIPEKNPASLAADQNAKRERAIRRSEREGQASDTHGDELPVRLLHNGKPVEGVLVAALSQAHPDMPVSARTDKDGRVKLKLAASGVWLVKAVHMSRAPADIDADWESLWASLTFELPAKPGSDIARQPEQSATP